MCPVLSVSVFLQRSLNHANKIVPFVSVSNCCEIYVRSDDEIKKKNRHILWSTLNTTVDETTSFGHGLKSESIFVVITSMRANDFNGFLQFYLGFLDLNLIPQYFPVLQVSGYPKRELTKISD